MIIAKNDEEKRSKIWRIVTGAASVLIVVVAVFFLVRMFTGNPLAGEWVSEDNGIYLQISRNSETQVTTDTFLQEYQVKVNADCTVDKSSKTITLRLEEAALSKAAEQSEGGITASDLLQELNILNGTFDYSMEDNELTLMEREYGEQLIFTRK